jgi:hypothetical protein
METAIDNTSGHGAAATVPAEIDRWNWGAFLLNWIWGIGNNTLIALLVFLPLANIVMPFVLGAKGSAWAWRNKRWDSIAQFQAVQRRWAQWGMILWLAMLALFVAMVFFVIHAIRHSDVYQLSAATVKASSLAAEELGTPITTGFPMGSVHMSGPRGKADISFSVKGPKGSGTVFIDADMDMGKWTIHRVVLQNDQTGRRIDLLHGPSASLPPTMASRVAA